MEKLKDEEIGKLPIGTILQNTGSGNAYVVVDTYGDIAVAVRSVTVTNASEWMIVSKPIKLN